MGAHNITYPLLRLLLQLLHVVVVLLLLLVLLLQQVEIALLEGGPYGRAGRMLHLQPRVLQLLLHRHRLQLRLLLLDHLQRHNDQNSEKKEKASCRFAVRH